MATYHPRPLVRENFFYAAKPGPTPYKLAPRPLHREPADYPLPMDPPPFPHFQTIGRGALKREPATVVPPEQRSRIPAPIYAKGAPRPQICRAVRPAAVAPFYVVPRSIVHVEEKKKVRWGGWTDEKMRRGSGSVRRRPVKSILKPPPPRQPRQHLNLHNGHRLLIPFGSTGSTKIIFKAHDQWANFGSFTTTYWMQRDRWIDQSSVKPGGCSVTCSGCLTRVHMSSKQSSMERMRKWNEHKRGCKVIRKTIKMEQLEMAL
ncbi:hypothetical protein BDZ89DRAFT_1071113 [Hymenopellis radicata]|nr:hypothetical protein BDZ89DRAFT_1071113 [Hymenopellis radicata]